MSDGAPDIVVVEDNREEARLIEEIFKQSDPAPQVRLFANGREALAFLRREAPPGRGPWPGMILLDLNLPEMDGREFLKIVKTDETLKRIPVVVLTGSDADDDIRGAYRQSANGYVIKPADPAAYREAIRGIGEFWLTTVTLPPR